MLGHLQEMRGELPNDGGHDRLTTRFAYYVYCRVRTDTISRASSRRSEKRPDLKPVERKPDLKESIVRKKTVVITSLAALGLLALGAGPVLADGMPSDMPDLEETLKAKPAPAQSGTAHMEGMRHGKDQMHGEMMRGHRMAMRESGSQEGASDMSHRSGGGC
ncbi:hypothetical protein PX554_24590 [Sphingomonas sp. H39-1-10]|uniref:hypothetical protein n=1 Tax=Alphaproteobacteria TaxID=28211 RepID=UPI0023B9A38D|nr:MULTISPECIES: hypothetical protein [Alphaproteobacteria]MDF0491298.1 hypothetical protein [Sphingomonas pollutisoli]